MLSALEREAKKSKRTLSAEVTVALARELRRRRLQELVVSYEKEKGIITAGGPGAGRMAPLHFLFAHPR